MKFDGLIDVLTQIPQVQIAILFGSASQDRMRPESSECWQCCLRNWVLFKHS